MTLKLVKGPSVYIVTAKALNNLYKIGFSADINKRMKSYHTAIPGQVRVEHIQYFNDCNGMKIAEKLLHYTLASFRPEGNKEWFETDDVNRFVSDLDRIADFVNGMTPVGGELTNTTEACEEEEEEESEEENEEWGRECSKCTSFLSEKDLTKKGRKWLCSECL